MADKKISAMTAIVGTDVNPAADYIPIIDASVADASKNKRILTSELISGMGITASVTELNYVDGVTSAIQTQLNNAVSVITAKVSISSAEILALNGAPKTLIAAPGAGKIIQPLMYLLVYTYGAATYAVNTTAQIYYNGVSSLGVVTSTILNRTESYIQRMGTASTTAFSFPVASADIKNKALIMDVQSGNPTTGDGTLDVYVSYAVITL